MAYRTPGVPSPHHSNIPSNTPMARRLGDPILSNRVARRTGSIAGLGVTTNRSWPVQGPDIGAAVAEAIQEVKAAVAAAVQGYNGALSAFNALQSALSGAQGQVGSGPLQAPASAASQVDSVLIAARQAISQAQAVIADADALYARGQRDWSFGSPQATYEPIINSMLERIQAAVTSSQRTASATAQAQSLADAQARSIPGIVQAARTAAQQQATQAQQEQQRQAAEALAAQQKAAQVDKATVDRARSSALALMNLGNFTGALAALQSQTVAEAASRIGYDLNPDVAAVTGAQASAEKASSAQAAQQKAQADCESAGGTWTGTRCDMASAREAAARSDASARVDAAIQRAGTLSAAGSYRAAIAALSGVARDAQSTGRTSEVNGLVAQIQDDQQAASCASRGGTWDGYVCNMPPPPPPPAPPPPPPPPPPAPPPPPDPQTECIRAGGQWDGSTCQMPPPSWLAQLLPALFAPPAPTPAAPPGAPSYAPVSQGPTQQQLQAMALLRAFGGPQGEKLAEALSSSMAPQGAITPGGEGVPDGTPCVLPYKQGRGREAGIYQGGSCVTVAPPSGILYGAPQQESF